MLRRALSPEKGVCGQLFSLGVKRQVFTNVSCSDYPNALLKPMLDVFMALEICTSEIFELALFFSFSRDYILRKLQHSTSLGTRHSTFFRVHCFIREKYYALKSWSTIIYFMAFSPNKFINRNSLFQADPNEQHWHEKNLFVRA